MSIGVIFIATKNVFYNPEWVFNFRFGFFTFFYLHLQMLNEFSALTHYNIFAKPSSSLKKRKPIIVTLHRHILHQEVLLHVRLWKSGSCKVIYA